MDDIFYFDLSASKIFSITKDNNIFAKEKFGSEYLTKVNGGF